MYASHVAGAAGVLPPAAGEAVRESIVGALAVAQTVGGAVIALVILPDRVAAPGAGDARVTSPAAAPVPVPEGAAG